MDTREITEAFLKAIETLDIDSAAQYCADSFTYSGPPPKPMSMKEWQVMAKSVKKAFPDWRFNAKLDRIEGNIAHITTQIKGTNRGEFDLKPIGMGVIPATDKIFALPFTTAKVTFQGNKIINFNLDVEIGSGIPNILSQLGVMVPKQ